MIAALLAIGVGCAPGECPPADERFDPTSLGFTPSDGAAADAPDGSESYFCSDGTWSTREDYVGHYFVACEISWCTLEGSFCVQPAQFDEWWDLERGHGRLIRWSGKARYPSGLECTPVESQD